jgi:hypothetical protein
VSRFEYLTPAGNKGDKRAWPIGTPVTATLTGGTTLKGVTATIPRMIAGGGWGVRVAGAPYLLSLDRVEPRYAVSLYEVPERGASESNKDAPPADGGRRSG